MGPGKTVAAYEQTVSSWEGGERHGVHKIECGELRG